MIKKRIILAVILISIILSVIIIAYFINNKTLNFSGLVIKKLNKQDNNIAGLNLSSGNTSNETEIFSIEPLTNEDIINDRIRIKNLDKETISGISIEINSKKVEILNENKIKPGEIKYFYLDGIYPAGKVNLKISYRNYSQEANFDVDEDWHVSVK
ncbi:hypothetical protein HYW74_02225 [Candidatus Pacearchaeota archaeon]|nr:hypothetical protein [Candidatus Pacearchaeota archaeon]